jgi:hypothetical protein
MHSVVRCAASAARSSPGGIGVRTGDALQPIPTLSEQAWLALSALLGLLAVRGRGVGRRWR